MTPNVKDKVGCVSCTSHIDLVCNFCMIVSCESHVHIMYNSCMYVSCTSHVHLMYIACTSHVHLMYVHLLYISCISHVHASHAFNCIAHVDSFTSSCLERTHGHCQVPPQRELEGCRRDIKDCVSTSCVYCGPPLWYVVCGVEPLH